MAINKKFGRFCHNLANLGTDGGQHLALLWNSGSGRNGVEPQVPLGDIRGLEGEVAKIASFALKIGIKCSISHILVALCIRMLPHSDHISKSIKVGVEVRRSSLSAIGGR